MEEINNKLMFLDKATENFLSVLCENRHNIVYQTDFFLWALSFLVYKVSYKCMFPFVTVLEIIKSFQCNSTLFENTFLSRVDETKLLSTPPEKLKRGNVIVCLSWIFTVYLTSLTLIHTNKLIFPYEDLPYVNERSHY